MKNFRGSALAAGVGTPESVPHELLGSSLHFIWFSNIGTVVFVAFTYLNVRYASEVTIRPSGESRGYIFAYCSVHAVTIVIIY